VADVKNAYIESFIVNPKTKLPKPKLVYGTSWMPRKRASRGARSTAQFTDT
jgi:hypothetical protein